MFDLDVGAELAEERHDGSKLHVAYQGLGLGVWAVVVDDAPHLVVDGLLLGGQQGEDSRLGGPVGAPGTDDVELVGRGKGLK